jgi:mRNA interferase MazF
MKLRPVLLLTAPVGPVPEILVAYISSVVPQELISSDLLIDPAQPQFDSTHLKTLSVLRLHKLATIHVSSLVRELGVLKEEEQAVVAGKLRQLLNLPRTAP